jgi:MYXO-CTERM domain-containing protein
VTTVAEGGAASNPETAGGKSGGCGCTTMGASNAGSLLAVVAPLALLGLRRKRS